MSKTRYSAQIKKHDGQYVGFIVEHPEAVAQGDDLDSLLDNLRQSLKTVLSFRLHQAEIVPKNW
jgi:predicted RNase H-like HicB family nuclease